MRINTLVNAGGTSLAARLRPFGAFRLLLAVGVFLGVSDVAAQGSQPSFKPDVMLQDYCARCHNDEDWQGGWSLADVDPYEPLANHEMWEKVLHKLRHHLMPPADSKKKRPDEATYAAMVDYLESSIDLAISGKVNPGRTESLRRLNRTEYQNAIRDLLALDIDATSQNSIGAWR